MCYQLLLLLCYVVYYLVGRGVVFVYGLVVGAVAVVVYTSFVGYLLCVGGEVLYYAAYWWCHYYILVIPFLVECAVVIIICRTVV